MIHCPHLGGDNQCEVAAGMAGCAVRTSPAACNACQNETNPRAINVVTIGMALVNRRRRKKDVVELEAMLANYLPDHGISRRCDKTRICGVPSMNSGVVMLRKCQRVLDALAFWRRRYHEGNDEILLTRSLLLHAVPSYVLPAEWNCRARDQVRHYSAIRITHHRHVLRLVQPDGSVPEELLKRWWETGVAENHGDVVR